MFCFTVIDKDNLVFLRRMGCQVTLRNLINIEYPHLYTCVQEDGSSYPLMTDLELKTLINNTSGPDVKHVFSRLTLLHILHELVKSFPVFEVNAFHLDLQARSISEDDDRRYKYAPGQTVPTLVQDGVEEYIALQYAGEPLAVPASAPRAVAQATPAGSATAQAQAPSAPASSDDFVQPRAGTSTHTIFTWCAVAWRDAGFPEDKKKLDDIRKKAVDSLVPTGLNVSTVRTQAARWYQHRQRFAL